MSRDCPPEVTSGGQLRVGDEPVTDFTLCDGAFLPSHNVPTTRNLLVMTRMLFVEDLVPGDRINIDGVKAVVRKQIPHGETQRLIELAHSSDSRTDMIVDVGVKVEVF